MGISRSAYYYEIKKAAAVAEWNKGLLDEIKEIFMKNKGRYGVRRVYQALIRRGHAVNSFGREAFFFGRTGEKIEESEWKDVEI